MNKPGLRAKLAGALALTTAVLFGSCTSGSDSNTTFGITSISVQPGQVWKINRPIQIGFSAPVDFSSVNLNTINIRRQGGAPSAGEFFLASPSVVVFQPRCPLLDDYSMSCRSAYRDWWHPEWRYGYLGFRPARSLLAAPQIG